MPNLLDRLKTRRVLLADGAMGTMLIQRGLKSGQPPEIINLERPELLEEISTLYVEAGAEIVQANTFGGSPIKLAMYGLADKIEEININAVRAVHKAVKGKGLVAASCGSCGKLLKPYGDTDPQEVLEGFERQISAIVSAGVDFINFETMIDIAEARLAVRAAKSVAPEIPVCCTMTFDATPRGFYTIMGVNVQQAAKELGEEGADIVGSNCGNGIQNMIAIAAEFKKHTRLPVSIRSNAGLPQIKGDTLIYPETAEYMAEKSRELLALGVEIIGGCCGTTPEHISALRKEVDLYLSAN